MERMLRCLAQQAAAGGGGAKHRPFAARMPVAATVKFRWLSSSSSGPPQAPGGVGLRKALASAAADEERSKSEKPAGWRKHEKPLRLVAGGTLVCGGLWQLAESHSLTPYLLDHAWDFASVGVIGAGALLATWNPSSPTATTKASSSSSSSRRPSLLQRFLFNAGSEEDDGNEESKFKFELLSDGYYKTSEKTLQKLLKSRLPSDVESRLKEKAKAEREEKSRRRKEFVDETRDWLKSSEEASAMSSDDLKAVLRGPRCFVYDFDTTNQRTPSSTALATTRQKALLLDSAVSFLQSVKAPGDQVIIRITSPGGAVSDFGHAASALARLRDTHDLTACVDGVAASGGYMVACVAHRICAAPFSVVGSIGVVAGLPNFSKVLGRADVDYMLFTAGKYKRTVTLFSPVEDEAKEKFQSELEVVHSAFKSHVASSRSIEEDRAEELATGEAWLAAKSPPGLVDEIKTSAQVIQEKIDAGIDVVLLKHNSRTKRRGILAQLAEDVKAHAARTLRTFVPSFSDVSPVAAAAAAADTAANTTGCYSGGSSAQAKAPRHPAVGNDH